MKFEEEMKGVVIEAFLGQGVNGGYDMMSMNPEVRRPHTPKTARHPLHVKFYQQAKKMKFQAMDF